jgi:hypothetical protein
MGAVLTTAATISCPHGGTVSLSSSSKLKVHGNKVLTQADVSSWSFTACVPNTQAGQVACTQVTSISPAASKLKAGGSGVILSGSAESNGTPNTLSESGSDSTLKAS